MATDRRSGRRVDGSLSLDPRPGGGEAGGERGLAANVRPQREGTVVPVAAAPDPPITQVAQRARAAGSRCVSTSRRGSAAGRRVPKLEGLIVTCRDEPVPLRREGAVAGSVVVPD